MNVPTPNFTVLYNNKNITKNISNDLISITYNDKTEGESDDLEIEVDDSKGLWRNSWYPEKGAKLTVTIEGMKAGVFEIDEIETKYAPDTVTIKGVATPVSGSLRTNKSDSHENKTLRQIVEKVASKNNLKIIGQVPDVTFNRVTQNKETDLSFLKRISQEYGVMFSVRDSSIIFTSIYEIESRLPSLILDITDLFPGANFTDKSMGVTKTASIRSKNPKKNEKIHVDLDFEAYKKKTGGSGDSPVSNDSSVVYSKTENKQQAELKSKALAHKSESNQVTGSLLTIGNVRLIAGNNFQLNGIGRNSGIYHITESTHSISVDSGYITSVSVKRLKIVDKSHHITKKTVNKKSQDSTVNNFDWGEFKYPFGNPTKAEVLK